MNWVGHMILTCQSDLIAAERIERITLIATSTASVLVFVGAVVIIFARTSGRIARLWCAMWLWISLSVLIFAIRNLGRLS